MKKKKNPIIIGTAILTATGFISRIIGFFYRIFLSNTIGEEGMGIYQLIFPVSGICFAICAASIQTAISRFVAAEATNDCHDKQRSVLKAGLFLTMLLSFATTAIVYCFAKPIATYILLESRCEGLLRILALSVPFVSIHACFCGYYYGLKKANIPAFSQMAEQLVRVISVWIIWKICLEEGVNLTAAGAVAGSLISDIASVIYLLLAFFWTEAVPKKANKQKNPSYFFPMIKQIFLMAAPLTANRLVINILQSAEAVLIPSRLKIFGMSSEQALSVYGVLTGMAMPFIFFPSALSNSVSVMLLPAIAEAQSQGSNRQIQKATGTNIRFCLWLGILFTAVFLLFGSQMGNYIFDSKLAGYFITILAWLCPFMYLTTTMGSILIGLGKTGTTFSHNMISLAIRLFFVVVLIPKYGIIAYLWGILLSQLVLALLHLISIRMSVNFPFSAFNSILHPVILAFLSGKAAKWFGTILMERYMIAPIISLGIGVFTMLLLFFIMAIVTVKRSDTTTTN